MVAGEAAAGHLGDGADVAALGALPDGEPAVLGLAGQAVLEHHQRGHHVGALHVADVHALDAQRRLVKAERVLQLLQRGRARGEVAGAAQLVLRERLLRVALHGLHQRPLVAALRHPQRHPRPAQLRQPVGDGFGVLGQFGHQHLARHRTAAAHIGLFGQRGLLAVELGQEPADQFA